MIELSCTKHHIGAYDVHVDGLPDDDETFRAQLETSLALWKSEGCKVVLLEIPLTKSTLIPVAVAVGFVFHFSAADYLMLVLPLVEDAPLVPSPTRFAAVGGLVFDGDKLLLVKNRGRSQFHFPGGFADPGEHLADAAVREVFEETSVRAEVDTLLFFRHVHDNIFRKGHPFSDIYFVFRLNALSSSIRLQENELDDGRWWTVDEALASEQVGEATKHSIRLGLKGEGLKRGWLEAYGRDKAMLETYSAGPPHLQVE